MIGAMAESFRYQRLHHDAYFSSGTLAWTETGPFSFTVDYHRIGGEDRLAQSGTKSLIDAEKASVGDSGCIPAGDIGNFRYFTNSLDTRTQGVDLVASVDLSPVAASLDENPFARDFGSKYPESAPTGFAGGFYYARARYTF